MNGLPLAVLELQEPDPRRRLAARRGRPAPPLPGGDRGLPRPGRAAALRHGPAPRGRLRAAGRLRHGRDAAAVLRRVEDAVPRAGGGGGGGRSAGSPRRRTSPSGACSSPRNLLDIVRNFVVYENDPKASRIIHKLPPLPAVPRREQGHGPHQGRRRSPRSAAASSGTRRGRASRSPCSGSRSSSGATRPSSTRPSSSSPTGPTSTTRSAGRSRPPASRTPTAPTACATCARSSPGPTGLTVTTTIQKFQDLAAAGRGPAARRRSLNEAENIFVLVDEAHRTQYRSLAANMRVALPNACFLGFTGTPIDKNDRSTKQTFGPYIDTYTIEQAVAGRRDGADLLRVAAARSSTSSAQSLDKLFEHVFADRTKEEREEIKQQVRHRGGHRRRRRSGSRPSASTSSSTTRSTSSPNGFKAQVVAVSREAAVIYKETLDRLNAPPSALIMSSTQRRRRAPGEVAPPATSSEGAHRAVQEAERPARHPGRLRHAHHRASTRRSSRSCTSTRR